jgi:ABC-2 type transport system permease protein
MKFVSLVERNTKELFRDPLNVFLGLFMPVLFLLLFSSLQERLPVELFKPEMLTPGILIFGFSFLIMFTSTMVAKDKQFSFLNRLLATPLKASDFILGYMVPFIPFAILQCVVCFSAALFMGADFGNIAIPVLILSLTAVTCISLGLIFGTIFTIGQASGVVSILITVISLFSGAWVELKMMGGLFVKIGYALPFAHAVDAIRALTKGAQLADISNNLNVIVVYSVLSFLLSIFVFKWKMKI